MTCVLSWHKLKMLSWLAVPRLFANSIQISRTLRNHSVFTLPVIKRPKHMVTLFASRTRRLSSTCNSEKYLT